MLTIELVHGNELAREILLFTRELQTMRLNEETSIKTLKRLIITKSGATVIKCELFSPCEDEPLLSHTLLKDLTDLNLVLYVHEFKRSDFVQVEIKFGGLSSDRCVPLHNSREFRNVLSYVRLHVSELKSHEGIYCIVNNSLVLPQTKLSQLACGRDYLEIDILKEDTFG
jgi:hypothetical protein